MKTRLNQKAKSNSIENPFNFYANYQTKAGDFSVKQKGEEETSTGIPEVNFMLLDVFDTIENKDPQLPRYYSGPMDYVGDLDIKYNGQEYKGPYSAKKLGEMKLARVKNLVVLSKKGDLGLFQVSGYSLSWFLSCTKGIDTDATPIMRAIFSGDVIENNYNKKEPFKVLEFEFSEETPQWSSAFEGATAQIKKYLSWCEHNGLERTSPDEIEANEAQAEQAEPQAQGYTGQLDV